MLNYTCSKEHTPKFPLKARLCDGYIRLTFLLSLSLSLFPFFSPSLSVGDERAPSDCPQKILFVVPGPQCELSLFESGLSIRVVQKTPLQCGIGRRQRFKEKKKKKSQRETDRGEEKGAEKVRGKKGF